VTLSEFIRSKGNQAAADLFGVPVRTVIAWRYGARRPRPDKAQTIVERTDGAVSFPEIYGTEESATAQ
jgi:DNA-binding transcriptional regulator YdaS (Cro superfamily)